jgi:5-methyltetrahydropteroyltriglutamate--homocysteine methyltransferase
LKRSTTHLLTTHVGSLTRPPEVVDLLTKHAAGTPFSGGEASVLQRAIAEGVREQAACGIDIPSDGEFSKSSFSFYVSERLNGFEQKTGGADSALRGRDRTRFADAYAEIESGPAGTGGIGNVAGAAVCVAPITYKGDALVLEDIANFQAALEGQGFEEAFIPAIAPGTIELQRRNEYYKTQEEYLFAIAEAMAVEYRLIVEGGFILQIDDPRVVTQYDTMDPAPTKEEYAKFASLRIEALNHALKGLPEDRIRYHLCWGSWHGPHTTDAPLKDIVDVILKVNAQGLSVEAANPRHAHEYHVWEDTKLPDGRILIPGVISHNTNGVEHPELVAERLVNYAERVGKENVIAGADCGFAQGFSTQRVHPSIMWEKFRMLSEGARLASERLWK